MQEEVRDSRHIIEEVLDFFSDEGSLKKLYKKAGSLYLLRSFKIELVPIQTIKESLVRISEKYSRGEFEELEFEWHKNERKNFLWFLICYSEEKKTLIPDISVEEWSRMGEIFWGKSPLFLKFQGLTLLKNIGKHTWRKKDDELLQMFIREVGQNQWNEASKRMFFENNRAEFISPKQCRERWFNHLNKEINHSEWLFEEERNLLGHVKEIGKKWSKIARLLGTKRTEHMIKNKYNSLIQKIRKKKAENQTELIDKALDSLAFRKSEEEIPHPFTALSCEEGASEQIQPEKKEEANKIKCEDDGKNVIDIKQLPAGNIGQFLAAFSETNKNNGSFIIQETFNAEVEALPGSLPSKSPFPQISPSPISPFGRPFFSNRSWNFMNKSGITYNMAPASELGRSQSSSFFSMTPNTPTASNSFENQTKAFKNSSFFIKENQEREEEPSAEFGMRNHLDQ